MQGFVNLCIAMRMLLMFAIRQHIRRLQNRVIYLST